MEAAGPDPLPGQQIQLLLPTGLLLTGPAAPLVSEDLVEGSPPPPGAALPPRELPRSVGGNQTLSTARHTRMGRRRPGSNGKVGVSLHLGGGWSEKQPGEPLSSPWWQADLGEGKEQELWSCEDTGSKPALA